MESITREDGKKLLLEFSSYENDKIAFIISGYGYSTNHPLLYYAKAVACQNGYSTLAIDFDYLNNASFLQLNPKMQDLYFDDDVKMLSKEISKIEFSNRIFIGKSMGTTVMNRLVESKIITQDDKLIYITPGNEWNLISENLLDNKNKALIIGSLADPKYTSINIDKIHKSKNVEFLEFTKENHGLEINDYSSDLKVILEVSNRINEFINK